jgi:hypothetical protein
MSNLLDETLIQSCLTDKERSQYQSRNERAIYAQITRISPCAYNDAIIGTLTRAV